MPITLTCGCGEQKSVANNLAGQCVTCVFCGNVIPVPALGVPVPRRTKPVSAQRPNQPSSRTQWVAILAAASGVLLLLGLGGLVAWAVRDAAMKRPNLVAEIKPIVSDEKQQLAAEPYKPIAPAPILESNPTLPERSIPKQRLERSQPIMPVIELAPKVTPMDPAIVPEKMAAKLLEPLTLVWKLKEADTFYQELIVTQRPNFKVQGALIESLLQYRIVSRFDVQKRNADGSLVVQQKIESAKILQADPLTRTTLVDAIAQMPGTIYTLALDPNMDVTQFQAGAEIKMQPVAGGQGLRMASLLDRDGWKELAQATFFQMDQQLKLNTRWTKPMTHAWGALGSWTGKINYTYAGPQEKLHKITYLLQMKHRALPGGQLGGMTINGANFQTQEAGGVLLFDAQRGKVVAAEERFRVKGVVNASLLGQNMLIEISEDQHFLIRTHDKKPE